MSKAINRKQANPKRPKSRLAFPIWITAERQSLMAFVRPSRSEVIDMQSISSFSGIAPNRDCPSTRLWSTDKEFTWGTDNSRRERSTDDSLQFGASPTKLPTQACSAPNWQPASDG
jgi:hypothetical protein